MTIYIERAICRDLNETIAREWLVTNNKGGYAAGTVAGVLTRKEHGLLVAQTPDAEIPRLLLTKIDEEVLFDQRTYYLGANEHCNGTISPSGFVHLESFHLENGSPIFTYRLGGREGLLLQKCIWMVLEQNTTYIQYRLLPGKATQEKSYRRDKASGTLSPTPDASASRQHIPVEITLLPFTAYRSYNAHQYGSLEQSYRVKVYTQTHAQRLAEADISDFKLPADMLGCSITPSEEQAPYHILLHAQQESHATFIPTGVWYWHFLHRHDTVAGQTVKDDLYLPGVIRATLWPDKASVLTIIASAEPLTRLLASHEYHVRSDRAWIYNSCTSHKQQSTSFVDAFQPFMRELAGNT